MTLRLVVGLVVLPIAALAQVPLDHLKCHAVKAPSTVAATLDLTTTDPALAAAGCTVGKLKRLCVPATKSNVVPPPVDPGLEGQTLNDLYLCYRLRCVRPDLPLSVDDQFGTHAVVVRKSSELCVPARPTVTTSTTSFTTTTTVRPACFGTVQIDPDGTVTTLARGGGTVIPIRVASAGGGVFDLVVDDNGAGGSTFCSSCSTVGIAPGGGTTIPVTYTAAADASSPVTLIATLYPHSVGFVCGPGSAPAAAIANFPVTP